MSEWRGLTMPDRHVTDERTGVSAYCQECWDLHCSQESPCKCCGKAEVERLTARIDAALAVCGEELDERGYGYGRDERAVGWNNLRADVLDALRGES